MTTASSMAWTLELADQPAPIGRVRYPGAGTGAGPRRLFSSIERSYVYVFEPHRLGPAQAL